MLFGLAQQAHHWKILHTPEQQGGLDPDQLRELCKKAGYTEEVAQQVGKQRAEARLDKGLPMFQSRYVHQ